jgi:hypothetical protein
MLDEQSVLHNLKKREIFLLEWEKQVGIRAAP